MLGALIARKRIFAKIKIIIPVLLGTFFMAALLNLSPMKIIMSVMFFMLVLMCNRSGDGRKFRRTSTVMYYTHMIFCKHSISRLIGFYFLLLYDKCVSLFIEHKRILQEEQNSKFAIWLSII